MDEFTALSFPSKVIVAACVGSLLYWAASLVKSVVTFLVALVRRLVPKRKPAVQPASSISGAGVDLVIPVKAAPPPGKSLKSLIKSQKRGGPGGPDHHADSELFICTLRGHSDAVTGLAWSADGSALATACEDRTLRLFDSSNPFAKTLPFRHTDTLRQGVLDVAFCGLQSHHVAVLTQGAANAAGLAVVDFSPKEPEVSWRQERIFSGKASSGLCLRGSTGSAAAGGSAAVLVAAAPEPQLRVFAATGGRCVDLGQVDTGGMAQYEAAVSRDGRFLAAATFTSDVKLYEVLWDRSGSCLGVKKAMDLARGHRSKVLCLDFSPDLKRMVTASADGTLIVWNIDVRYKQQEDPKRMLVAGLPLPKGSCYSHLAWGPGGHIAAAHGSTVYLLDARSGEPVDVIREAHAGEVTALAWAPSRVEGPQGRVALLASAGRDGRVRLWRGPWLEV